MGEGSKGQGGGMEAREECTQGDELLGKELAFQGQVSQADEITFWRQNKWKHSSGKKGNISMD